jgi:hypothetical protein
VDPHRLRERQTALTEFAREDLHASRQEFGHSGLDPGRPLPLLRGASLSRQGEVPEQERAVKTLRPIRKAEVGEAERGASAGCPRVADRVYVNMYAALRTCDEPRCSQFWKEDPGELGVRPTRTDA